MCTFDFSPVSILSLSRISYIRRVFPTTYQWKRLRSTIMAITLDVQAAVVWETKAIASRIKRYRDGGNDRGSILSCILVLLTSRTIEKSITPTLPDISLGAASRNLRRELYFRLESFIARDSFSVLITFFFFLSLYRPHFTMKLCMST